MVRAARSPSVCRPARPPTWRSSARRRIESLAAQGKIVAGSGVPIGGIAIGVAIKKGAARPDITTVDALKRTLLAARSIGYRDPATGSTSGTWTARMIEKLGLTSELQARTKLDNSDGEHPELVFQALVNGETELQFGQITEIVMADGVEVLGPLPAELQQVTLLTAGVSTTARHRRPPRRSSASSPAPTPPRS